MLETGLGDCCCSEVEFVLWVVGVGFELAEGTVEETVDALLHAAANKRIRGAANNIFFMRLF